MNVLLLKKIKKLGDIGQEVSVKAGYARNFLFPKKFALPMTRENIEIVEQKKQELIKIEKELKDKALENQKQFENYELVFDVNIHEEDKLFGSITLQNVLDKLLDDGMVVQKRDINMPLGPIKELSDKNIATISLHPEVKVTIPIKLNVVQSDNTEETPSKE
mgnify:FL=1|tara:strand:+ start:483 stop:968 length:486 start_codon:yes stop_codon:yes gene_type:complete